MSALAASMREAPDPGSSTRGAPDPRTVAPETAEDVAAALRRASDARQSIQIRGAGTKLHWGRATRDVDAVLDMRGLNRILAHEHGDMTATVEAGATLRDVNRTLAQHGQWLPLDPPFADAATIGGILATNDSGPLRHRFGTPRDLVIGVRLATTDGVLSKAGGQVVKNVAGYDLGKLLTGSFGALAAIVSATFKLAPLPNASRTLRLDVDTAAAVARIVTTIMTSQLEPIAFEIAARATQRPPDAQNQFVSAVSPDSAFQVLLRFASLPAVVDAQLDQATAILGDSASAVHVVDDDAEETAWREHAERVWSDDTAAVIRASWLPAHIEAMLAALHESSTAVDLMLVGRASVGCGLIRIAGELGAQVQTIERLRTSHAIGNVVVVRGSTALNERVDVWGPAGSRSRLFESLKQAFDPNRVLVGQGPL
jgi:glycolate oxidase FAD binding subunit